jgi:CheY-like chemotaxis protein
MKEHRPVLVVDDERGICMMVKEALGLEGYAVATAYDGQEALEFLARYPGEYTIMLDTLMPVMDGFKVLERLSATPEQRVRYRVIMMVSGYDLERARDMGADEVLARPFTCDQLMAAIEAVGG